ncbi:hypothetical protein DMC25_12925, partial [Caulobacter sp. D4A]|uniref:hypothetical protein n=1 Tax=Caulobacter sp. D4A TaxID=2204171 RepID=UPI000D937ACE
DATDLPNPPQSRSIASRRRMVAGLAPLRCGETGVIMQRFWTRLIQGGEKVARGWIGWGLV